MDVVEEVQEVKKSAGLDNNSGMDSSGTNECPPPDGKFEDPDEMTESIKRFSQENGYAICIRRSEKEKNNIFKCGSADQNQQKNNPHNNPKFTFTIILPLAILWPTSPTKKFNNKTHQEVQQLANSGLKPSQTLQNLKQTHPEKKILATISTIYTAKKESILSNQAAIMKSCYLIESIWKHHVAFHQVLIDWSWKQV
ncbi:hypothetical protein VP01_3786g1 [Puccinia sorghi]|uniref:Uncharacterized protein n=1 Tax=Puccinia sorghi TaxID=27349 RepID=A0A0L6UTJ5_9BASI|nr:hypothetical protein VP01_3786g1 [Puccinia sorghi]